MNQTSHSGTQGMLASAEEVCCSRRAGLAHSYAMIPGPIANWVSGTRQELGQQLEEVGERIVQRIKLMGDRLEAEMWLSQSRSVAKSLNWEARKNSDTLFVVCACDGTVPDDFLLTARVFKALSRDDLSALIVRYEIADRNKIPRKLASRRKLLTRHIGMSLFR